MFSYIYACETCTVCVRNIHVLYLASDGYCIQCMCILKLWVRLKPGRRTCIYRQFKVYENLLSITRQVRIYSTYTCTCTCIYIFVYTQYQSLHVGSVQTLYTNSGKKMAQQHTIFITPLIHYCTQTDCMALPHSDIVHPESLRMKRTHWDCAFSTHAH